MPEIKALKQPCNGKKRIMVIEETYRALGKEDLIEEKEKSKKESFNLCFYDASIHKDKWKNQAKISLNKKSGKLETRPASNYKIDRFKLQE